MDNLPLLADTFSGLGIRPNDIEPDDQGNVHAGDSGLSCFASTPADLPQMLRPKALGGTSNGTVFALETNDLPATLRAVLNEPPPDHWVIGPATTMTLDEFINLIRETRNRWVPL